MNVLQSRLISVLRLKTLETCLRTTRLLSSGIIPNKADTFDHSGMTSQKTSLPDNVVVLGVEESNLNPKEYVASGIPIPDDCKVIRKTSDYSPHLTPPLAWLHSFESVDYLPSTAVELHPEIFACHPRMDFLHRCKEWQEKYREVDYSWAPTRAEMGRGRKKPWPQKGTGRARHGSRVGPQWKHGGIANGPRGPRALFQKILPSVRLRALTSALTIKHAQNNLLVVKDFNLDSPKPAEFENILSENQIADASALLVFAKNDNLNERSNAFSAVADWPKVNLMPLIALNVWSLLHHEWLVLTTSALDDLEKKVSWHLHRFNWIDKPHNYYRDLPFEVKNYTPESFEESA